MANELILMPLRIGIRVANVCLRPVVSVAEQLLSLTGRGRDTTAHHDTPGERSAGAASASAEPATASAAATEAPPASSTLARESASFAAVQTETSAAESYASEVPEHVSEEPEHVSEEPELVSEVAEPGAEDGAGAQMRVDEPWPGFRELTADQIIERLEASSPEELAVIELYERSNRQRRSVISAVERELKRAAAGRPAS